MSAKIPNPLDRQRKSDGFTLVEMMVVIAIIGILAALLLPLLSRSKQKAQGIFCLNNTRQLMAAMTLYTGDYHDYFPPNPDDGNTVPGHNWCGGKAGQGYPDEFNPDILTDPTRDLVAPYIKGDATLFHCPADKRFGKYQGLNVALMGTTVSAARSVSMNQAVGTICPGFDSGPPQQDHKPHQGAPTLAVNGPWLNSRRTHHRDAPWYTYGKMSTINAPGPAMLWVLVDEDVNGLNDAAFAFGMEVPHWVDAPGIYHNGGCGFAFADGHSESHQWISAKSKKQAPGVRINDPGDMRDWLWMRERTSANVNGSMPDPQP